MALGPPQPCRVWREETVAAVPLLRSATNCPLPDNDLGPSNPEGANPCTLYKTLSRQIHLLTSNGRRRCRLESADADHTIAAGCCPTCDTVPFRVQGTGRRIATDDRAYEADA